MHTCLHHHMGNFVHSFIQYVELWPHMLKYDSQKKKKWKNKKKTKMHSPWLSSLSVRDLHMTFHFNPLSVSVLLLAIIQHHSSTSSRRSFRLTYGQLLSRKEKFFGSRKERGSGIRRAVSPLLCSIKYSLYFSTNTWLWRGDNGLKIKFQSSRGEMLIEINLWVSFAL